MRGRILVVDDEPAIREVVQLNLEAEGYEVTAAESVERALETFGSGEFVLAILDVMLPDGDGFELARAIRDRSDIPIMMLSARDTDIDKAVGLGVGADDYVTKPFSPVELIARVKAHLRRYAGGVGGAALPGSRRMSDTSDAIIHKGAVTIDLARRRVTVRGDEADLTAKEFDILRLLAEHPSRVHTKAAAVAIAPTLSNTFATAQSVASERMSWPEFFGLGSMTMGTWYGTLLFGLTLLSLFAQAAWASALGLTGFAWSQVWAAARDVFTVALLLFLTLPVVALIAVVGRGVLAPMIFSAFGFTVGMLGGIAGWNEWLPWAMPTAIGGSFMGSLVPAETTVLGPGSWAIVLAMFGLGLAAVMWWVNHADSRH